MGYDHEVCNTKLSLGIGLDDFIPNYKKLDQQKKKSVISFDLTFPLHFKDEEEERQRSNNNDDDTNNGGIRKKLRLTKEQISVLEGTFKKQSTPNTARKKEIAEELNLKPKQVEVWFQNRRARTKVKQTEIHCDLLRKNCENLRDENQMLKKELRELQYLKMGIPSASLHLQIPAMAATIAVCHSCERMAKSKHESSSSRGRYGP